MFDVKIKKEVTIEEANALMEALAAIVNDETREMFRSHMSYSVGTNNPKQIVESCFANMLAILADWVQERKNAPGTAYDSVAL